MGAVLAVSSVHNLCDKLRGENLTEEDIPGEGKKALRLKNAAP